MDQFIKYENPFEKLTIHLENGGLCVYASFIKINQNCAVEREEGMSFESALCMANREKNFEADN